MQKPTKSNNLRQEENGDLERKVKKETTHIRSLFKIWIGAKFHCSPFEVKSKIWKCVSCTAKRVNTKNNSHELVNKGREKWGPAPPPPKKKKKK